MRLPTVSLVLCLLAAIHATGQSPLNPDIIPGGPRNCSPSLPADLAQWYRTDRAFAIDPNNPLTMYLNVEWKGFYKSTDGGLTWKNASNGIKAYGSLSDLNSPCYGEVPVALVDPLNSNRILLGNASSPGTLTDPNSASGGVYESLDGGASFHQLIQGWMNAYTTSAVVLQPGDSTVLYYGTTSQPADWTGAPLTPYVTKGIVYQTLDSARTWLELPTGLVTNVGASGIHIDPKNPNNILVSTFSKNVDPTAQLGLLRSTDRGSTWQQLTSLPAAYSAVVKDSVAALNFSHIYLISQALPPNPARNYYSIDGGVTFQPSGMYMDVAAHDPLDPAGNHMLGYDWSTLPPTAGEVLWESNDAGASWHVLGNLPPEILDVTDKTTLPSNFVFDPKDRTKVYMNGAGGYVWRSTDSGKTWASIVNSTTLPNKTFSANGPAPVITAVVNAADNSTQISANSFIAITGQNLASATRAWAGTDFSPTLLPTGLEQVDVFIGGLQAYVEYVSPGQVNVLTPLGLTPTAGGSHNLVLYSAGVPSQYFPIQILPAAPAPFIYGADTGHNYVVATHANYGLIGPPSVYADSTPAKPGETIIIWANGLGVTNPATSEGQIIAGAFPLAQPLSVAFGGTSVSAAGWLVSSGLYQINVTVPANETSGDVAIRIVTSNGNSDGKATVFVQP